MDKVAEKNQLIRFISKHKKECDFIFYLNDLEILDNKQYYEAMSLLIQTSKFENNFAKKMLIL